LPSVFLFFQEDPSPDPSCLPFPCGFDWWPWLVGKELPVFLVAARMAVGVIK
jgi:hypothetical protein